MMKALVVYLTEGSAKTAENALSLLSAHGDQCSIFSLKEYDDLYSKQCSGMIESSDVVIAAGGDGTMIHAAKAAAAKGKPMLGINSGHVGFMAGLESAEIDLLGMLLDNRFRIEKRMLLEISAAENGKKIYSGYALNEAVISRGSVAKTSDLLVSLNGSSEIEYRADGIIAATPTGSTAYSLSAGGPVLDPEISGIILTPLCPHSINSRSVILGDTTEIKVRCAPENRCDIYLCVDGERAVNITNATVYIKRAADMHVELIRIKNESFYDVFRKKIIRNIY